MTAGRGRADNAAEQLRFLHATLDSIAAHVAVLDADADIIYVNGGWKEFAAANARPDQRGRCLEGNYLEVLRKAVEAQSEGSRELLAKFERLISGEVDEIRQDYPCHSATEERYYLVTASRIEGLETRGYAVVHTNITDRVRAERAERERDALKRRGEDEALVTLRAFASALPDLVFAMSPEGVFRDVLSGGSALAVPPENFLGKSVLDIFPGGLGQRFLDLIREAVTSGRPQSMGYQLPLPADGRVHDFEVRAFQAGGSTVYTIVRDTTELADATRALEASDARFRSFYESTREAIVVADIEDRILDVNPAACEMLGYTREEFLRLRIPDIQAPECRRSPGTAIREELEVGRLFETVDIRKDGTRIDVEVMTSRLGGGADHVICNVRDITARKRREETLKLLNHAVEQSGWGVVITDPEGRMLYVNRSVEALTGYTREELLGRKTRLFKSGQTPPEEYERLWAAIGTGQTWSGRFLNRGKDGRLFWEAASVSPVFDEAGRITHYVAIKEDITEKLKLSESLVESEERFRRLAEHIHEVFWVFELDQGTFSFVSRAYEDIWHRSIRDGYPTFAEWLETVHEEDRERVQAAAATLATAERIDIEYRIRRPDGSIRWVRSRGYPMAPEGGRSMRAMGLTTDTTRERLAKEKELETMRREASVGRIAAAVAHEINNPLGTIKFLLRSLSKSVAPELGSGRVDGRPSLGILEEQVNRIATTTRALLGFSRQRNQGQESLPAADVIGNVVDLFKGGARGSGHPVQHEHHPGAPAHRRRRGSVPGGPHQPPGERA